MVDKPDRKKKSVPVYDLFGEEKGWQAPDPIHIEPLSVRSSTYDWEIPVHFHDSLYQVMFVKSGHFVTHFDGREVEVQAPAVVSIPPLIVHGFSWSPDVDGYVLMVQSSAFSEWLMASERLQQAVTSVLIFGGEEGPTPEDGIDFMFQKLVEEFGRLERQGRQLAMRSALGMVMVWLARKEMKSLAVSAAVEEKSSLRVRQFRDLVNVHFKSQKPLSFYARELGITTTHLNNLCREVTKKSALEIVHERIMLEAKRRLIYATVSVSEMAYDLGFNDPGYFSRFFKRNAGISPYAYRKNVQSELSTSDT